MSSRTYLSIGDVLTLLREEFPDVTISKIRFLESQGLVNPERSPSGYRKFFEHDVERLRWVLRQQREHFLPLKVIRDRLAEGDLDDVPEGAAAAEAQVEESAQSNGRVVERAHADVGVGGGNGAATVGRHSIGSASSGADDEPLTKADSEAMARILADASRRAARMPDVPREVVPSAEATPGPVSTPAIRTEQPAPTSSARSGAQRTPAPARAADTQTQPPTAATRPTRQPNEAAAGHRSGKGVDVVAEAVASAAKRGEGGQSGSPKAAGSPAAGAGGRASSGAGAQAASMKASGSTPTGSGRVGTTAMVTGASLSADELCSASGLSVTELASLEGFGLIECVVVAGLPTYDEDALTVANLAAELRIFGIEPRHLRLYKNAVDREVGLIEQVIIPLLRQRNPESRQRALDSAEQLGTLGQTMRATLMRSALRRHLGG